MAGHIAFECFLSQNDDHSLNPASHHHTANSQTSTCAFAIGLMLSKAPIVNDSIAETKSESVICAYDGKTGSILSSSSPTTTVESTNKLASEPFGVHDTIRVSVDLEINKVEFFKNGHSQGSITIFVPEGQVSWLKFVCMFVCFF